MIIAKMRHTTIDVDEEGIALITDEQGASAYTPPQKDLKQMKWRLAEALVALHGPDENAMMLPQKNLVTLMNAAEESIREAFDLLEGP